MGRATLRVLINTHGGTCVSIETNLFCGCLHDCCVEVGDYVMEKSVNLSVSQQFDVERMNRAIESTIDPQQLQVLAKQLLQAWHSQRAATVWITRQREQLG